MDVYIGFGLLSAGIVVVLGIIFDSWLKRRNAKLSELSAMYENHRETDNMDSVSLSRVTYDIPRGNRYTELADICEDAELVSEQPVDEYATVKKINEPVDEIRKPHPKTVEKTNEVLSAAHEKNKAMPANLLVLSIMAKKESRFESYDLLQAISAAGMQYGEMNIFHYYQATPVGKIALFSMASANKPGDFDMNNIAEISCSGLMMFMDIGQTPDPQSAFKLMLDTAERLAEDLDAALCSDPLTPWNEKLAWQYHQKIMQYKTASKHDNKIHT